MVYHVPDHFNIVLYFVRLNLIKMNKFDGIVCFKHFMHDWI